MNVRKSIEQALVEAKELTGEEFTVEKLVIKFESDASGNIVPSVSELHLRQRKSG
jgi:hypothetical protein